MQVQDKNQSYESNAKTNNIAYIYLCHNNPELLVRVAQVLKYGNDAIFVHVDNKVDIAPFVEHAKNCSNVHFIKKRIDNYWGGFNSVIATIELMRMALSFGDYSRFVLLQGQDYPLISPKGIHTFFDGNDIEYCKAKDVTISSNKKDYMTCCGYWYFDCDRQKIINNGIRFILSRINQLGIKYRSGVFHNSGDKWHVFKGWAQFALTKSCVKHIIDIYDSNHKYNKFMKHRFPPDEIYFHTIIHNSKFKDKVSDRIIVNRSGEKTLLNLTYFEYPVYVTVFTEKSDYQWLKNTGCLFVRKVNSSSVDLLNEIDENIKMDKDFSTEKQP